MAKTRLLQAVCTVAMLAAVPAFAQTNAPASDTGTGSAQMNPNSTMTPADQMGSHRGSMSGSHAAMEGGHRQAMTRGRTDTSQNEEIDRLNDQSLQAARSGQAFNGGSGSMSGGSMSPSGSMNDMSGGSMSGGSTMPRGSMSGGSMSPSGTR